MESRIKMIGRILPEYMITAAGIAAVVFALVTTEFRMGKPECVIHILMWAALAGFAVHADICNHGRAGESSMLIILTGLFMASVNISCGIFAVPNLAHAPAVCAFILIAGLAVLIGKYALLRAGLAMGILICIYSSREFPGYEYLGHKFHYLMYLSEILMFAGAVLYSFKLDEDKAVLPEMKFSRFALGILYPDEQDLPVETNKKRCLFQAGFMAASCALMAIAAFLYEIRIPWLYLITLCLFMLAAIWQSSYSGFRYDSLMVGTAMFIKLAVDLSWELAPAEYDYTALIALMDAFCAVAAAGRSRIFFRCGVIAELVMSAAAVTEYYFDSAVYMFGGGQIIMISKLIITIAVALYAYGCWSSPDDEEEVNGNETIRQIQKS